MGPLCPSPNCFFFPVQAEKEKLQQAGDGNPQRVLLLAPEQPVPERGGQGGAGEEVQHHSFPGG